MACVYAARFPVRSGVTVNEILGLLSEWLNDNPCNSFRDIAFLEQAFPMDVRCPEAQLSAASAEMAGTVFTAVRLQSHGALSPALPSPENMSFRLGFLMEEGVDAAFFTLWLHCSPRDPNRPASLPRLTTPEILWQMAERGLFASDGGFPIQQTPLTVTPQLEKTLQMHRNGTVLSALPLIFVREGNYALTPKLAASLSQCAHVLLLPAIHPALSGLGAGGARIFFPRLGVSRTVDLTAPTAGEDIPEYLSRLTALAIPGDLPAFSQIRTLCGHGEQPSSDYLCMNRRMADSIRFYRIKSGLTQAELAQKAGTTGLLISRLENNRPARVREALITAIEGALHLTNREIFACEGVERPAEPPVSRPLYCPRCGTKTLENGQFCHGCGSKLS